MRFCRNETLYYHLTGYSNSSDIFKKVLQAYMTTLVRPICEGVCGFILQFIINNIPEI